MITVHHLERSRSLRVVWLLEELGRPYRITPHRRDPKTQLAGPELRALHPTGTAPLIEEDGQIFAETGAIFEHLLEGQDSLLPPAQHARIRYWLHHAEGSAMPPLVMTLVFDSAAEKAPWFVRPLARQIAKGTKAAYHGPQLQRLTAFWEDTLAQNGWFGGAEFSAADVMMSFPVEAAQSRADVAARPATRDWLERIHARPAYQRAVERCRTALGGESV